MNIEALLAKADTAKPVGRPAYSRWHKIYPVYEKLRLRNLSGREAVEWLIAEKAVQESDKAKAMESLQKLEWRRKREA